MGNFYSFLRLSHEFFAVLKTFWQISAKLMSFLHLSPENFRETHELLASILCFWCPFWCYYCCWLVSTISSFLAVVGLPSAVDICDVLIVSATVSKFSSCEFLLLLLVSLLNIVVFSTVYSSSPTADSIHDDANAPAAAAISDFNSIPAFADIHTVLVVLLSLLFLLLHMRSCCCECSWYCFHSCNCLVLALMLLLVSLPLLASRQW